MAEGNQDGVRTNGANVFPIIIRLFAFGFGSFLASYICACSLPSKSDTDESRAPRAPISARPSDGSDVGGGTSSVFTRFQGAIGLVEIFDAKGNRISTCTGTALARDLTLTSSRCASDCARTRLRFPGKAKDAASSCASVEILESTAGKGFALLRLATKKSGDALPSALVALDEKASAKGDAAVYLLVAAETRGRVTLTPTSRCLLRYSDATTLEATHSCAVTSSATGGLLVDSTTLAARAVADRTEGGARLATPSGAILSR